MIKKIYFLSCVLGVIVTSCSVKDQSTEYTTPIHLMESPSRPTSAEPFLFTDKDSTVYLSWIEKNKEESTLRFSSLKNGAWSNPINIASGTTWFVNWADYPVLAANGNYLIAHYLDKSGEGKYSYDIKLTTSNDKGNNWSEPVILHDDKKQAEHGFVSLLPYEENFFVTWLDGRNTVMEGMEGTSHHEGHYGSMSLRAAVVDPKGNKRNEWELDNKTCDCCQTAAAITSNGPVVVYRDRSDEEIRDMSIVRLIDGRWTEPKAIHNDNWKIAGCPVNGPAISALGNNLAIAWFSSAADTARVSVIFSTDGGGTFGKPIRIDEGKTIGRVDIFMIDNTSAIASWMEGATIKAVKVHADGTKQKSIVIGNSSDSRSSGFPQMTKAGNQLIFAWTDDSLKNIRVASLDL